MAGIAAFISYFFNAALVVECTLLVGFVFVLNLKRIIHAAIGRFMPKPDKD
jgi:hypothetical protein